MSLLSGYSSQNLQCSCFLLFVVIEELMFFANSTFENQLAIVEEAFPTLILIS